MSSPSPNLILLTVDALRADHLSYEGYYRDTSPNIDAFATENTHFSPAYSVSTHTREALPTILSGQYPDQAVTDGYVRGCETVASKLRAVGYTTAGFHSNPFVSRAYGFDDGFDEFDDDLHFGSNRFVALAQRGLDKLRNRHYARGSQINDRSLSWLDTIDDEPFFLWNHYMDVHGPYEPPGPYATRFTDERVSSRESSRLYKRAINSPDTLSDDERRLLIDLYDGEIRYTDDCIGRFLDALDQRGLLEDSYIVLTADHGDAFGEHGYYEHPRYLHDELTRVPLAISGPMVDHGRIDTLTSTLDVVPTLLDAAGVDDDLPGESLLQTASASPRDRIVYLQVRGENDESTLRRFGARTRDAAADIVYDLDEERVVEDSGDSREIVERLRTHIEERTTTQAFSDVETEATKEVEQRLKALGYDE